MRRVRRNLSPEARALGSRRIVEQLVELDLQGPVFVYWSVRGELDTRPLLRLFEGRIAIPRITGDGQMEAARYDGITRPGTFGVPTTDGPVLACATILVPGLAFDRSGGRLGYGGGYYDRWLAAHPLVRSIGLAFACQEVDVVPRESHDHVLDHVLFG